MDCWKFQFKAPIFSQMRENYANDAEKNNLEIDIYARYKHKVSEELINLLDLLGNFCLHYGP